MSTVIRRLATWAICSTSRTFLLERAGQGLPSVLISGPEAILCGPSWAKAPTLGAERIQTCCIESANQVPGRQSYPVACGEAVEGRLIISERFRGMCTVDCWHVTCIAGTRCERSNNLRAPMDGRCQTGRGSQRPPPQPFLPSSPHLRYPFTEDRAHATNRAKVPRRHPSRR